MDQKQVQPYYVEYLLYKSIGKAIKDNNLEIKMSHRRYLRNKVESTLREKYGKSYPFGNITEICEAFDKVFTEAFGDRYSSIFEDKQFRLKTGMEFRAMTGMPMTEEQKKLFDTYYKGRNNSQIGKEYSVPVSPYGRIWSTSYNVLSKGDQLLRLSVKEINEKLGGNLPSMISSDEGRSDLESLKLYRVDNIGVLRDAGQTISDKDIAKFTPLVPYIEKSKIDDYADWVMGPMRVGENKIVSATKAISDEALDKALYILRNLDEKGIEYSIEKDLNPGQLKVRIKNSNIDIRLTDIKANEAYIGRCYYNGVSVTFKPENNAYARNSKPEKYNASLDEVIDLVDFVQFGKSADHDRIKWDKSFWKTNVLAVPYESRSGHRVEISFDKADYREPFTFLISDRESEENKVLAAKKFLADSVLSANINIIEQIDVEGLYNFYLEGVTDEDDIKSRFEQNSDIAAIQARCWDQFGQGITLDEIKKGVIEEVSDLVGDYGVDADGKLDPVLVSQFMTSSRSQMENIDDLINTMQISGYDTDNLLGNTFQMKIIKDRMIKFQVDSSKVFDVEKGLLNQDGSVYKSDGVQVRALKVVKDSLESMGQRVNRIEIDDNGIVKYETDKLSIIRGKESSQSVTGYLGQIFDYKEGENVIETQFAGGENYVFSPGYEAVILKQKLGENKSVEERTKLRGYEQMLGDEIRKQIMSDVLSSRTTIGTTSSINRVYRRLYDTRHDLDFVQRFENDELNKKIQDAILATESRVVRYSNYVRDGSTINAEYRAEQYGVDLNNDFFQDAWLLTDGRNMSIMGSEGDGFFDPMMTAGSTNQGITRYLVEGAVVGSDGLIERSSLDDRTPIAKLEELSTMSFDPFDRQQMTYKNMLSSNSITKPTNTAMMTIGAWNADDPIIVSKSFAEANPIIKKDGSKRPLKVGDKLSDFHGNKGVISIIVDKDMTLEDSQNENIEKLVDVFKKNPELDVIMSPFSAVSRYNGGTARDLMNDPKALVLDGEVVPGGMGQMQFIVTSMAVDSKTKIYDDEDLIQGKGRKASSQLSWALGAKDCKYIMREMYGKNAKSIVDIKEYLIVMGLDIDGEGGLRPTNTELTNIEDSSRAVYTLPEIEDVVEQIKAVRRQNDINKGVEPKSEYNILDQSVLSAMRKSFSKKIKDKGGVLELPVKIKLASGEMTDKVPVISSHLRRGQELADGSLSVHDYTRYYEELYTAAAKYKFYREKLSKVDESADYSTALKFKTNMDAAEAKMQKSYDNIANDIKIKRFEGKHNVFKDLAMSSRLPNSATAVWTSDPRLRLDEVAMSPEMMKQLGVKLGDSVLIWRDPILKDGGVRYLKVVEGENLTGVSVNPAMTKSLDGDFDGDSIAVVRLTDKKAIREAEEKFSPKANMLDFGAKKDGLYPLYFQNSLDTKVSQHQNPELKAEFESITLEANKLWENRDNCDYLVESEKLLYKLDDFYQKAWKDQYGGAVLRFDSLESHVESVIESCVDTGAKGSYSKVEDYCKYLGVRVSGNIQDPESRTFVDMGKTQSTLEDHEGTQMATAIKSFGTGVAGKFSQRGVRMLRNEDLKAVLELTYPVTQAILQAKHDPKEAKLKYDALKGPVRDLWRGYLIDENGKTVRDKGEPFMATRGQWIESFINIYTNSDFLGVEVNREHVESVADILSGASMVVDEDDKNDMMMSGVELLDDKDFDFHNTFASTMDILAYDGNFELLLEAAKERMNLYDGKLNSYFKPNIVRFNETLVEKAKEERLAGNVEKAEELEGNVRSIGTKDVEYGYQPKRKGIVLNFTETVENVDKGLDF